MIPWLYKINIKQHLGEETDKAAIEKAYVGIMSEIRSLVPLGIISRGGIRHFEHYATLAIEQEDASIFNLGMDHLYTWADEERVWLG